MAKSQQVRNLERLRDYQSGNREAAEIILADPEKYDGLPLMWANAWMAKYAHEKIKLPKKKKIKTIEERLADHAAKQKVKRISKRRSRWGNRKWHRSRKGSYYLRVNGFVLITFERYGQWSIGIIDKRFKQDEMTFMTKKCPTEETAREEAFNALLFGESRRQHNLLVTARKGIAV